MLARVRVGVASLLLVAALGAASGCSSGDNATGAPSTSRQGTASSTGKFKAEIDKLLQRPTSIGITEPIKGGVPKGKSITYLQCAFPDCVQIGDALQKAVDKVGWRLSRINAGASPETIKAAWAEALRRNPDGIVQTGGAPHSIYKAELNQAIARKIPLIGIAEKEDGSPWLLVIGSGVGEGTITSTIAAKFVSTKIDGGKVLAVNIPGVGIVEKEIETFRAQLPQFCPKCSVDVLDIPPTSLGKDATTKIASRVQANPGYKFMFLSTIDLALGLNAALASAGVQPVPTVAQTTSANGLDALKKGEAGLVATTEYPSVEGAYRIVDAFARHFRGQSVDVDQDATLPRG